MAYADPIRQEKYSWNSLADLIDGIGGADSTLAYQPWTPTLGVNGGTFTGTTINYARYVQIGKLVIGELKVSGTTGSTANFLTASVPVNAINSSSQNQVGSFISSVAGANSVVSQSFINAQVFRIYGDHLRGGWADGAAIFWGSFSYEAQ
jgi:hypothetical protein